MSTSEHEESFLTVAEVAALLRLNQQTVRNWIDAGSLPAVHVGRRVRIKRADLDRIVESGYRGSPPPAASAPGPNADDFWGGEPVGAAEADPHNGGIRTAPDDQADGGSSSDAAPGAAR